MCNSYDPENPVIKVAADFYKVDLGAAASETPETQPLGQKKQQADELDLMSLL